jgi:hypothetical protein
MANNPHTPGWQSKIQNGLDAFHTEPAIPSTQNDGSAASGRLTAQRNFLMLRVKPDHSPCLELSGFAGNFFSNFLAFKGKEGKSFHRPHF